MAIIKPDDIKPIGFNPSPELLVQVAELANETLTLPPAKVKSVHRLGITDTEYGDLRLTVKLIAKGVAAELEVVRPQPKNRRIFFDNLTFFLGEHK